MTVSPWWDRYQEGGADALAAQERGPAVGAHRLARRCRGMRERIRGHGAVSGRRGGYCEWKLNTPPS